MDKEQLRQYYRRFCRWQQVPFHYVNRHQNSVQRCHNCGTEFSDNFCPRCGQRAELGRVGWQSVKDNISLLWGLDSRSLGYTLLQLLARPGYLVRDYISGHRQVSFPPIKMLVIISLFTAIIESVFHVKSSTWDFQAGVPEIDIVIKWLNDNKSWGALFFQVFFILPTWAVFRFAPRYPRHTLPEGFFLQVFLCALSLLSGILGYLFGGIENVLDITYMLVTYRQLFGYGWWSTLWRCIVTSLTSIMMMLPFFAPIIWSDNEVRMSRVIAAVLILFVVVTLLSAVILFITYRISRKNAKRPATQW